GGALCDISHLDVNGSVFLFACGKACDHLGESGSERASVCCDATTARNGVRRRHVRKESAQTLAPAHHLTHLAVEHLPGCELFQLKVTHRGLEQHALRHQPDDFAPGYH